MSSNRVLPPLPAPARPASRTGPVRRRPGVRVAALAAVAVLGVAACGDADGAAGGESSGAPAGVAGEDNPELDGVTVEGAFGEAPTITFEPPLELEESQSEVLSVGDGDEVGDGDTVTIDYSIASGASGGELETSFGTTSISLPLVEGQTTPDLITALVGQTLGSRVLVAVAPEADAAQANPAAAETIVFVIDLLGVVPSRADGEPVEVPEGTPVVETDDEGDVTALVVDGVEPTEELVVTPVLQGDGPEVEAGDNVTIQYTGVLASDGTQFDSSWERGAPTSFPLGNLIQGWQQGLQGVAVGSRVVLQVPPELGYGAEGQPPTIPGDADLVFVIDVLATESGPEAPAPVPSQ